MEKKYVDSGEFNLSSKEYCTREDDYDSKIREFDVISDNSFQQEFGSQPQNEFNTRGTDISAKAPKKSKFKKMIRYFVAGVASAALIVNTVRTDVKSTSDEIKLNLNFETYMYTIEPGNVYQIYFDADKEDDYYWYLAEYIYEITRVFDEKTYSRVMQFDADDYNIDRVNTKINRYYEGEFFWVSYFRLYDDDGETKLVTGYSDVMSVAHRYDDGYSDYYIAYCIGLESQAKVAYLDDLLEKYQGLSKTEIYKIIRGYPISQKTLVTAAENFKNNWYNYTDGTWENQSQNYGIAQSFYVKNQAYELIVPTFLKIVNLTELGLFEE